MNKKQMQKLAQESKVPAAKSEVPMPWAIDEGIVRALYVALVGGADFQRTQLGTADVCRLALTRAKVAARVWNEERGE